MVEKTRKYSILQYVIPTNQALQAQKEKKVYIPKGYDDWNFNFMDFMDSEYQVARCSKEKTWSHTRRMSVWCLELGWRLIKSIYYLAVDLRREFNQHPNGCRRAMGSPQTLYLGKHVVWNEHLSLQSEYTENLT